MKKSLKLLLLGSGTTAASLALGGTGIVYETLRSVDPELLRSLRKREWWMYNS